MKKKKPHKLIRSLRSLVWKNKQPKLVTVDGWLILCWLHSVFFCCWLFCSIFYYYLSPKTKSQSFIFLVFGLQSLFLSHYHYFVVCVFILFLFWFLCVCYFFRVVSKVIVIEDCTSIRNIKRLCCNENQQLFWIT